MTFRRVLLTVATAAAPAGVPDRAQNHIAHAGADHEQHEVEHPKEDREIGGPPRNVLRKGLWIVSPCNICFLLTCLAYP